MNCGELSFQTAEDIIITAWMGTLVSKHFESGLVAASVVLGYLAPPGYSYE
jgi:hypothetical protein